jgi:hypothetical protein
MNTPLLEIATNAPPRTVDGTALDHDCLHCQLALPIQHFIGRHPNKSREQLIIEVCEVVAELVASSTPVWYDARNMANFAVQQLNDQVYRKFQAFERLRQAPAARGD